MIFSGRVRRKYDELGGIQDKSAFKALFRRLFQSAVVRTFIPPAGRLAGLPVSQALTHPPHAPAASAP